MGELGFGMGDVGCGNWDLGFGMGDVVCGIWDVGWGIHVQREIGYEKMIAHPAAGMNPDS
jgi:hypothetical protein